MSKAILDAVVDRATARSREARQKKVSKNTASSWRITWEDSLKEFYPECRVTYGMKDAANLNRMIRTRGLPVDDLIPFFRWVVENWARLRLHVFSNFPGKAWGPEAPDMKFLLAHIARVHAEYERSKPEVAAALPLAHRTGKTLKPVASPPAPAKPVKRPTATLHALRPPTSLLKAPAFDAKRAEAARVKLGVKRWDD